MQFHATDLDPMAGFAVRSTIAELVDRLLPAFPPSAPRPWASPLSAATEITAHLACLAEAMEIGFPALCRDHLRWLRGAVLVRGGSRAHWRRYVDAVHVACSRQDPAVRAWIGRHLGPAASGSPRARPSPLSPAARACLEALVEGDRHRATARVLALLDQPADALRLLDDIVNPVQREVGELWYRGRLSEAVERQCSAVGAELAHKLGGVLPRSQALGRRAVVACPDGEQHVIGACMVTDRLRAAGWDVALCGDGRAGAGILHAVIEQRAHLLLLSAATAARLPAVRMSITALRALPECAGVQVMVGGAIFRAHPQLWMRVGADGFAADAAAAVAEARRLCSRPAAGPARPAPPPPNADDAVLGAA